uniref:Spen paralogue and orthologue SPOC C-terminal domain-containing protein n=1 Tax=Kalanchoe fedtschenkoi TaxID=63787 RepID=A0A7N0U9M8_KALFE
MEQPLKKRKIFDAFLSEPPQSETLAQAAPPPPLSQEDLAKRRRNREEVRNVHDVYRRIKYCIDHKDLPQLHQSYLSLITAAKGCTSAQRIIADLIPRYAPYCSTTLEPAVEALISIHSWSLDMISKAEDDGGIAFDTAAACVVGLADICCIASQTSPVMHGVCSSIFQTVLVFFISSLEKQDLHLFVDDDTIEKLQSDKLFPELKQKILDEDKDIANKLLTLRCLSLYRIFVCRPKEILSACFKFMHISEKEGSLDKCLYFLRQVMTRFEAKVSNHSANASHDIKSCPGSVQTTASWNSPNCTVKDTGNDNNRGSVFRTASDSCLLEMVLAKDHSLRNWLISKYKKLHGSVQSEDVSAIISSLEGLLKSNSEADTIEGSHGSFVEDDTVTASSSSQHLHDSYQANEHGISFSQSHTVSLVLTSAENATVSHVEPQNATIPGGSAQSHHADSKYEKAGFDSRHNGDLPRVVLDKQLLSPRPRKPSDLQPEMLQVKTSNIQNDKNKVSDLSSHTSGSTALASPAKGQRTNSGNQVTELLDGDSSAMDIFFASKILWVGSLTPEVSEGYLRFQFERLGPLESFQLCHVNSCAVVGFKYIMDAIKARDYMRMHTPWDIRFSNGMGMLPFDSIPATSSVYAYIGNISSQWVKDEILFECRKVIHSGPCMITDLTREGALLLEFETPEEAAKVMIHLRRHRREKMPSLNSGPVAFARTQMDDGRTKQGYSHGVIRNNVSGSVSKSAIESPHPVSQSPVNSSGINIQSQPGNHYVAPFNSISEGGHRELMSSRMQPDNHRNLPQGGHAVHSHWPVSEAEGRTLSGGYTEQMWACTTAEVNLSGVTSQGPVSQPQHFQAAQYMRPVFAPPNSSWDLHGGNPPMNVNPPLSGIRNNQSYGVTAVAPFVTAAITPLAPARGNSLQHYDSASSSVVMPPPLAAISHPQQGLPAPSHSPHPPAHPHPPAPLSHSSPQMQPLSALPFSNTGNAAPSTQYRWQGTLSKSGVRFCTVLAKITDSEICKYTNVDSEPFEWPSKFDMTKRTDFQHVKSTFNSTPPHKREVCRLFPLASADRKGFQDFISYLKQRNCVGVIKVPAGKSMWARLIFLLPHSLDICSLLAISPSPSDCLIALVVPKEPCIKG